MEFLWFIPVALLVIGIVPLALGFKRLRRRAVDLENRYHKEITLKKRQAAKALYFESILQDSKDIIFTVDNQGFILKFNRGAELNLGYSQSEIVGQPLSMLLKDKEILDDLLVEVSEDKELKGREVEMLGKFGEFIYTDLNISRMNLDDFLMQGWVITCKNISQKKKMEQEILEKNKLLEELAITDNLSGLFNVRHFHKEMSKELTRLKRGYIAKLSLLMIDIDKFKNLNDTLGHQEGDKVINTVGKIINGTIRKEVDGGFRYGGDEFVVLLPGADSEQSRIVAQRIIDQYNSFNYAPTSLSVGVTEIFKDHEEEEIVKLADEAMYEAKRGGGNRILIKNLD
jgi:diguanylate cyclase (GGDEF)-like protein/PAS domain S-box-containing protein